MALAAAEPKSIGDVTRQNFNLVAAALAAGSAEGRNYEGGDRGYVVKNTFVETPADSDEREARVLRRSYSDSDVSPASEHGSHDANKPVPWWVSMSSSASQSSDKNSSRPGGLTSSRGSSRAPKASLKGSDRGLAGSNFQPQVFGPPSPWGSSHGQAAEREPEDVRKAVFPDGPGGGGKSSSSAAGPSGHSDLRGPPGHFVEPGKPPGLFEPRQPPGVLDGRPREGQLGQQPPQGLPHQPRRTGGPPQQMSGPVARDVKLAKTANHLVERMHQETKVHTRVLADLHNQGFLEKIPRNDKQELTSVGSIGHSEGNCTPCLFWFRSSCSKGIKCDYCHFKHKGQRNKRIRPSRQTRERMRVWNGDGTEQRLDSNGNAACDHYGESDSDEEGEEGEGHASAAGSCNLPHHMTKMSL